MPPPYCYEYPRPAVTIDLTVFTRDEAGLRVLLIKRKKDPYAGRWAIPGGFLDIDEPVESGARRELREETGLEVAGPVAFLGVYADPGRDPRGRTISLAHGAVVRGPAPKVAGSDDAEEAGWHDPHDPPPLAFDHGTILADALRWLKHAVFYHDAGRALLPDEFGAEDVAGLLAMAGRSGESLSFLANMWLEFQAREGKIAPVVEGGDRYRAVS